MALQANAQSISVTVPAALRTLWTRVQHKLRRRLCRRQEIEARVLEGCGLHLKRAGFQFVPPPHTFHAQQPDGLLPQIASHSLEIAALEQNCPCSQRIQQMFAAIASRIKQTASVVIAESRWRATTAQEEQGGKHFLQRLLKDLRDRNVIYAGQHSRMQEKIERVHVVVS